MWKAIVSGLSVFLLAATMEAQPPVRSLPTPSCAPACLSWDTIAILGDREGPGQVFNQSRVASGPDGSYFVTSLMEPGVIRVFDSAGEFIESFGRVGQGPGEYMGAPMVLPSGNPLVIVDDFGATCTRLRSPDRSPEVRRMPFRPTTVARLDESRILIGAVAWSRDYIGLPLHIFDCEQGEVLHSFGGSPGQTVTRRDHYSMERIVGAATTGPVWAARRNRFLLETWSRDGELLGAYERGVDWFTPWQFHPGGGVHTQPPPPMVQRLAVQEGGFVWVLIRVAAENWAPTAPDRITADGMEYLDDMTLHRLQDSVVELWQVEGTSVRVIASDRMPLRAGGFAAPGVLYIYDEDDHGSPRYLIVRALPIPREHL